MSRDLTRRIVLATVIGLAASGLAAAANMGFTRSVSSLSDPGPGIYWLSLPYRYTPEDVGLPAVVDAEDLCQDLGSEGVDAVLRWDEPSSTFVEHPCGGGAPFVLTVGTGYGVRLLPEWYPFANLAGGHDDDFEYSIPPTAGGQLSWLSVPYHLRIPENGSDPTIDAEDLCTQIGASEVFAIVRRVEPAGVYEAYGCGSVLQPPFEIVRGQSYGVVNRPGQAITWQPDHS
jgi:hypothetical protein